MSCILRFFCCVVYCILKCNIIGELLRITNVDYREALGGVRRDMAGVGKRKRLYYIDVR